MDKNKKCDIFISYRRKEGWELARLVYKYLDENNYNVFFDIERLFKGSFADGLAKNLDDCKVFIPILTRKTLERCVTEEDDWVKKEYLTALAAKDKIIIPIQDDSFIMQKGLPQEIIDMCDKSKYSKDNPSRPLFISTSKETFENDILQINNQLIEIFKNQSFMDVEENNEKIDSPCILRKEMENKSTLSQEKIDEIVDFVRSTNYSDVYERLHDLIFEIRSKIGNCKVLDISTGDGYFEHTFFKRNSYNVNQFINIDPNIDSVKIKKQLFYGDDRIDILNWYPNESSFGQDLKSLKTEFNIVFIVDILNKFKDPASIIRAVKDVMAKDGIIVIWQQDFGLSFTYPDWNGQLKQFNKILNESKWNGNKITGREVYTYLHSLNFKNIHYDLIVNSFTQDQKEDLFNKKFYDLLFHLKNEGTSQMAQIKWLDEERNNLKKKYCSNKAFNSESFFLWVAKK